MPTFVASLIGFVAQLVHTPKPRIVMTTSFFEQHISMGIHDIMYQISQ